MHVALIRFALVAPVGDIGSESTPPIGLAYLSSIAKKYGATVVGVDASGMDLNKSFKISKYNLQGNGLNLNEILELVHPDTEVHVNYKGKQQLFLLAAYDIIFNTDRVY